MSTDVFELHCDAIPKAKLVAFRGVERLGRPYSFDVFVAVPGGTDVRKLIGTRASLTMDRGGTREPVAWHGVFDQVRLGGAGPDTIQCTLVPALARAGRSARSYVHTKKTLTDFAKKTLEAAGLEPDALEFATVGTYGEEEFV